MALEIGDEVIFAEQPQPGDQVLLLSDRGFGKRVLFMEFEPQARGGKGVKAFYFNKSGSNGTGIAGALLLGEQLGTALLSQRKSPPSLLNMAEVISQGKQDKGMPYVMAIMDDVITGVLAYPSASAYAGDTGDENGEN